jgi:hypothetical protein
VHQTDKNAGNFMLIGCKKDVCSATKGRQVSNEGVGAVPWIYIYIFHVGSRPVGNKIQIELL